MVPRPRLGTGGLLLWGFAIVLALAMAWLDFQHMARRGALEEAGGAEQPPSEAPAGLQPIEVLSGAPGADAGAEAVDAGAR